jgi:hypothetical protein
MFKWLGVVGGEAYWLKGFGMVERGGDRLNGSGGG